MSTVTISRQLGSLGHEVARAAADRLGYRLVWREAINQAARQAGAPEVALAAIDELGLLGLCPSPKACHAYHRAVRQVMEELANKGGVVILGRAGQVILRDHPEVLHVRVVAPKRLRVERISRRHGISLQASEAQVEASDRYRQAYLRRFYHVRGDDSDLYDLFINTGRLSPGGAANLICEALLTWPDGPCADASAEYERILESI
jgi:cytidylate kinase